MITVAILGFGVVGSGVAELIEGVGEGLRKKADALLELKYILDVRDFPQSPFSGCFVKDFSVIENDPEIDIVVETIGGAGVALDFTERALKAGKSVVTSNKELVATKGQYLMELARAKGATYLFEASVGGGIPILRPLNQCMAANEILEICGILNGTSNYISTRMIAGGLSFEEALREAQAKGYAEADPSADVEGHDSCRKICILASIALGWHVLPEQASTIGIRDVSLADVEEAGRLGCKIKLLGRAIRHPDGRVCVYVEPHLIEQANPLAGVEDVFNAVTVKGNATGDVMFYGKGAGKLPTASAVVADVIAIARQMERSAYRLWSPPRPDGAVPVSLMKSRWYLRFADRVLITDERLTRDEALASGGEKAPLSAIRVLD